MWWLVGTACLLFNALYEVSIQLKSLQRAVDENSIWWKCFSTVAVLLNLFHFFSFLDLRHWKKVVFFAMIAQFSASVFWHPLLTSSAYCVPQFSTIPKMTSSGSSFSSSRLWIERILQKMRMFSSTTYVSSGNLTPIPLTRTARSRLYSCS